MSGVVWRCSPERGCAATGARDGFPAVFRDETMRRRYRRPEFLRGFDTSCTSSTQLASSDGYGHTKPGARETRLRRIGRRHIRRPCVNNCDFRRRQKPDGYGEIHPGRLERSRAGSRDPAARLSELSFRKYDLAMVCPDPADFPANPQRCSEGPGIHGSIKVERLYGGRTAGLHGGHRSGYPESSHAASEICVDAPRSSTVQ